MTEDTLELLIDLGRAAKIPEKIAAMFGGEHLNATEDRAVLHPALRAPKCAFGEHISCYPYGGIKVNCINMQKLATCVRLVMIGAAESLGIRMMRIHMMTISMPAMKTPN